jgi:hypothetical protein
MIPGKIASDKANAIRDLQNEILKKIWEQHC